LDLEALSLLYRLVNFEDSDEYMQSLHAFGLFRDDGYISDGFDDPSNEDWNGWKVHHDMKPEALCILYRSQDLRRGDLHIGGNELLLTNEKLFEDQTEMGIACVIDDHGRGCSCNALKNFGTGYGIWGAGTSGLPSCSGPAPTALRCSRRRTIEKRTGATSQKSVT
jgi:hypothetical protein